MDPSINIRRVARAISSFRVKRAIVSDVRGMVFRTTSMVFRAPCVTNTSTNIPNVCRLSVGYVSYLRNLYGCSLTILSVTLIVYMVVSHVNQILSSCIRTMGRFSYSV